MARDSAKATKGASADAMIRSLAAQGVVHAEVYISFGIIYYWKQTDPEPFVAAIERARIEAPAESARARVPTTVSPAPVTS